MTRRKVKSVSVGKAPQSVTITWEDRRISEVDLSDLIGALEYLRPLDAPDLFATVGVEEWGWSIKWANDISLGADLLWRLGLEQSGEAMAPADFKSWRRRNKLSQEKAAKALGLAKRTIIYYETGEKIIPKTVLLATRGFDASLQTSSHGQPPVYLDSDLFAAMQSAIAEKSRIKDRDNITSHFVPNEKKPSAGAKEVVDLNKYREEHSKLQKAI